MEPTVKFAVVITLHIFSNKLRARKLDKKHQNC